MQQLFVQYMYNTNSRILFGKFPSYNIAFYSHMQSLETYTIFS
jgi:hypothetical protein